MSTSRSCENTSKPSGTKGFPCRRRPWRSQLCRIFRGETGIEFPLLVDEHRQAYVIANLGSANLLHMLRRDNFKSRDRARAAGHHQHKLGPNPFQLGGSFIFTAGNIDRFAHVSKTFGDNASPATLLAALDQIEYQT